MFWARKRGDWAEAKSILSLHGAARASRAIKMASLRYGHFLRGKIIRKITGGGFVPHAEATPLIRRGAGFGGGKILIVSGTLVGSVVVKKVGSLIFVGVARGRTTSSGKDVAVVAAYHEYGHDYRANAAQKRYIFAMIRKSGGYDDGVAASSGGLQITIPKRAFIEPVEKRYARRRVMARKMGKDFARLMRGKLGTIR